MKGKKEEDKNIKFCEAIMKVLMHQVMMQSMKKQCRLSSKAYKEGPVWSKVSSGMFQQ